ncbi:phosphonate C-P lyase system protein PhnG [Clostridium sp. MSJ-8]|uniref:phosphonate C-P lyase system protein PhnG n=1 Tax=Clostridium sp. MSJ-8 TaxID=2841510 RepID=UPI001C0EA582|nr:phosphonate C-P lyase system protein PhnG [Clostridium sp. MSJ-8]MBU5487723.1 phosphonate C-P lyase system protein PhnG [Clostridium sp. MSJ-8]
MNRRERTRILIESKNNVAQKIADDIRQNYEINIIQEPENGLTMVKVRETAKKQLFYLGEVIIIEAKCSIDGVIGIGIVANDDEDLVLNLAIIDAAYNKEIKEIDKYDRMLEEEKINIDKYQEEINQEILQTKVDFTTMNI